MSTCVAPTLFFLARIEATICASVSISIGRSTVIRMSSAGASSSAPPHAMQRAGRSTTWRIRSGASATSASVPIVSAVPAGLVIAREEVLGTVRPSAARIGTTIIVVRLPGTPPTQCLSTIGPAPKLQLRAGRDHRAREVDQLVEVERVHRARQHEHRQFHPRVAMMSDVGEDGVEGGATEPPPRSFSRTRSTLRGATASVALTGAPSGSPRSRKASSVSPISSSAMSVSEQKPSTPETWRVVAGLRIHADDARAIHRIETEIALGHRAAVDHDDPLAQRFDTQVLEPEHPVFHRRNRSRIKVAPAPRITPHQSRTV